MPYIFWSFYFFKKGYDENKISYPVIAGVLSAVASSIKPFYAVYLILFALINLVFNYPYKKEFKERLKVTLLTAGGFIAIVLVFLGIMHALGMLLPFLKEGIPHAIEFKKYGSPFFWNLFSTVFQYSPAVGFRDPNVFWYMIVYGLLFFMSWAFIIVKIIQKDLRNYFPLSLIFIISVLLILYQKNGEVVNHHIPMIVMKSILGALFIKMAVEYIFRLVEKNKPTDKSLVSMANFCSVIIIILLSRPLVAVPFDRVTWSLLQGRIGLEKYRRTKYPVKSQEDMIVSFINKNINKDNDEILYFCYSYYIQYRTKTKSFRKFNNNLSFLMTPERSPLYNKFRDELVEEFKKFPPELVVVRKDDTWWSKNTSFREWKTSYEVLMGFPYIRNQLENHYKKVIDLPAYAVFEKIDRGK